jgi:hypothetical protein
VKGVEKVSLSAKGEEEEGGVEEVALRGAGESRVAGEGGVEEKKRGGNGVGHSSKRTKGVKESIAQSESQVGAPSTAVTGSGSWVRQHVQGAPAPGSKSSTCGGRIPRILHSEDDDDDFC